MNLSGVQELVWAGGFAANCILLAVLLLRRRAAGFPAFSSLIGFYVARTIVLFGIALHSSIGSHLYFRTYWSLAYLGDVIQFVVFYELARHVFCPTGIWTRDTRRAFGWLVAGSVALALALALVASPSSAHWYQTYLLRSNFFMSALMSELFIGMLVLSVSAGLPWKTHAARIAQGFGASALISVALQGANNYFGLGHGQRAYSLIGDAEGFSTLAFVGFWIVTLWRDAPAPRELPDAMLMQIYTLQRRVENDLIRIRSWRRS